MSGDMKMVITVLMQIFLFGHSYAQGKLSELGCGTLDNAYGPYDYRIHKKELAVVERFHFTPKVELLQQHNVGGDLDYTLRAYPNHHRALLAMQKLGEKQKKAKPSGADYSVECYMVRAEEFQPNDAMVKVIYGLYLIKSGRTSDAVAKFEHAALLDPRNPNVQYNLGLAYLDLKKYDKALESAHKAYAGGFPLPGLRERLKRAGKWADPVN